MRAALLYGLLLWALISAAASPAPGAARQMKHAGREVELVVLTSATPARTEALLDWAQSYVRAARTSTGAFPLQRARIEIREIDSADPSPVPWGQTLRDAPPVKVLLYVRKSASIEALKADWTAPHELAHLHHPFLGRSGRWLAEGWASYSQHRFMVRAGVLSEAQAWEKLLAGFGRGAASTQRGPIADLSHQHGGTMRIYWGGAAFWLTLDLRLRARGLGALDALMARYSDCCMKGEIYSESNPVQGQSRALEFLQALEDLLGGKAEILALYHQHAELDRFPALDAALQELGLRQRADGVQFDQEPRYVRLRRAIMLGTAR